MSTADGEKISTIINGNEIPKKMTVLILFIGFGRHHG